MMKPIADVMTKVFRTANYDDSFPELYEDWQKIDSARLAEVSYYVVEAIYKDMKTKERNLVPGLRDSLNLLAECAWIENTYITKEKGK